MAEIVGIAFALIAVFGFFALLSLGVLGVAIWFGCLLVGLFVYRTIQRNGDPSAAYRAEERGRRSSLP